MSLKLVQRWLNVDIYQLVVEVHEVPTWPICGPEAALNIPWRNWDTKEVDSKTWSPWEVIGRLIKFLTVKKEKKHTALDGSSVTRVRDNIYATGNSSYKDSHRGSSKECELGEHVWDDWWFGWRVGLTKIKTESTEEFYSDPRRVFILFSSIPDAEPRDKKTWVFGSLAARLERFGQKLNW